MLGNTIKSDIYVGSVVETLVNEMAIDAQALATTKFAQYLDKFGVDQNPSLKTLQGEEVLKEGVLTLSSQHKWINGESKFVTDVSVYKWNTDGLKEALVETDTDFINVKNFVDVNVNALSDTGTTVNVYGAKRGEISTGNGNDAVNVHVQSNGAAWSNHFDIDTGDGNDTISFFEIAGGDYTEFNISAGKGNDVVNVAGLSEADCNTHRSAHGGEGIDALYLSGNNALEFTGFEVVIGDGASDLHITQELLDNNVVGTWEDNPDGSANVMVFTDVNLTIDAGLVEYASYFSTYTAEDLTDAMTQRLSDFGVDYTAQYTIAEFYTESGDYLIVTDTSASDLIDSVIDYV
ncbi:hypothetical protein CW749_13795 [Vibrio sp. vnigr-6D03]|uniref:hypothetical protein n=1 Tax=Vibrio sp. vnigr-6D03 TaxID=2058088 RepID=UPI000C3383D3|nr:hypothetical protein [Vibrio sp. vnigr-6D03]PKF79038.1 hypothetical protein CW749_13795 [Vibrio sp. vnigr-6D03]